MPANCVDPERVAARVVVVVATGVCVGMRLRVDPAARRTLDLGAAVPAMARAPAGATPTAAAPTAAAPTAVAPTAVEGTSQRRRPLCQCITKTKCSASIGVRPRARGTKTR